MKLISWLLLVTIGLAGCATPGASEVRSGVKQDLQAEEGSAAGEDSAEETSANLESVGEIEVEKNIFDVSITLPPDLAGVSSQEEVDAAVSQSGYSSGTLNSDGSVTYQIPSDVHAELLEGVREAVQESANQYVTDEPQIYKSISFDRSVETFEVVVDRAEYESSFTFAGLGLTFAAAFYHIFAGSEDPQFEVRFIDESNGEVFSTYLPEGD